MNLGAMAMQGYSAFPKAPASLEPQYQIVLCHIQDPHWGSLQRSSRCILQPQPSGSHLLCSCFLRKNVALGPTEYKYFFSRSIWLIDETLTDIIIPNQIGAGSYDNECILHTPHISRIGDSLSGMVYSHTQESTHIQVNDNLWGLRSHSIVSFKLDKYLNVA